MIGPPVSRAKAAPTLDRIVVRSGSTNQTHCPAPFDEGGCLQRSMVSLPRSLAGRWRCFLGHAQVGRQRFLPADWPMKTVHSLSGHLTLLHPARICAF